MTYKGVELYEKDGAYGVLVSPGFGAGWSTWEKDELAYDKRVVEFWLSHKDDAEWMSTVDYGVSPAAKEAKGFFESIGYGDPYMGGFDQIVLKFVGPGVWWRITEYDGSESLETFENAGFVKFD